MSLVRPLQPSDAAALDAFLARHADSSMFLRSNALAAGLVDRGEPLQATYVAAVEPGGIVGVAAHCWNGMVLVQAPAHAAALAPEAVRRSRRAVSGFSGPWDQVVAARRALGLDAAPTTRASRGDLYGLDLAELVLPTVLASGTLRCRHPAERELALLAAWPASFAVEALGAAAGPELRTASRADVRLLHERGADWVVLAGGRPGAHFPLHAPPPENLRKGRGGAPPPPRGRGYGRAVVAGSLLAARERNVRRAVLFADPRNTAAQRAYLALGFRIAGDYGLVLLKG